MSYDAGTMVIRCDAGPHIGTGHLMRCLALAHGWRGHGGEAFLVGRIDRGGLQSRIADAGVVFVPLAKETDVTGVEKLITTLDAARDSEDHQSRLPWVVLDGYHFDTAMQQTLRRRGCRVLVIDDTRCLDYYDAHILLNQNIGASRLRYDCAEDTRLLLGLDYVMLQPPFLKWQGWKHPLSEVAHRVLVTFGGSDPHNQTSMALRALKEVDLPELEVVVVVGAYNIDAEELRSTIGNLPNRIQVRVVHDVDNMPELMSWADVAIAAAGSTSWELAFMGTPALLIAVADNQKGIMAGLEEAGVSVSLGWWEKTTAAQIAEKMTDLARDSRRRSRMSALGQQLVDGHGCERIIACLCQLDSTPACSGKEMLSS